MQHVPTLPAVGKQPWPGNPRLDTGFARGTEPRTGMDFLISLLNFWFRTKYNIYKSNFQFASIHRDAFQFASQLARGQFFKIYGRYSGQFKYHVLQQYENSVRKFDVVDALATQIGSSGNAAFYQALGSEVTGDAVPFNHAPDLQRLDGVDTLHSSGEYLHLQLLKVKGPEVAKLAKERYMRGFSRTIVAADPTDWQAFRDEVIEGRHVGAEKGRMDDDGAMLFAISYKGTSVKITRRMVLLTEEGEEDSEAGLVQETNRLTSDILNDFRWSQIVRSCMTIAAEHGRRTVRIWLDRLVMMGTDTEERRRIYELVDWEDFGLFAYVVCPVVRVYDRSEVEFGTDFWRKLETVMGVAGRGLVVDDYMLRQFDKSVFFGSELYSRHLNGLSVIGGGGVYVRGVTLAVATAVLSDAVTVRQANEDLRTVRSIDGWKAWALRTIAEGAYSANHSLLMLKEKPMEINLRNFQLIALWESLVSRSGLLTGKSYMDMSLLRSTEYTKSSLWDGVVEWVGMMPRSCVIREREEILRFLAQHVVVELYAAATGHVASMLSLRTAFGSHKRTLVVDLTRYSSAENGQVTAVAEATGLWNGSVLPKWLKFVPNPDVDQKAEIDDDSGVVFTYEEMAVVNWWTWILILVWILVGILAAIVAGMRSLILLITGLVVWIGILVVIWCVFWRWSFVLNWPWVDESGVGEALFDNLLKHGLYDSGIKSQYRKLVSKPYDQLKWF